jgi:hypothetical protein
MVHLHEIRACRILLAALLLASVFPVFLETASAQKGVSYYWVALNPKAPGLIVHSPLALNWTISFLATWTYGGNSGQAIVNATVPLDVRTINGTLIESLLSKTNATGFASFSYSSPTPDVLTFTPTKLVTKEGVEWNSSLLEETPSGASVYGFQSKSVTIYWDSYDASLVSIDTDTLGIVKVSVNITYLMIPPGGLTMAQLLNQSRSEFVPKYVHDANVTINGVKAEESSTPGVYTAETFTWLPTAYILVQISQRGWPQTPKAFSHTHSANLVVWTPATIIVLICTLILLVYVFVYRGKRGVGGRLKGQGVNVAAVLLVIASIMSMYWALVGVESVLHGFDWLLFGMFGIFAFAFGLAGGVMSKMRKHFALTMIAVCLPLIENAALVKFSFDIYELAIPWTLVALAITFSTLSGILIGTSDEEFS